MKNCIVWTLLIVAGIAGVASSQAQDKQVKAKNESHVNVAVWEDRSPLSASEVYRGPAGLKSDAADRLPKPPFSHFEQDNTPNAASPKCKVKDSNGVKWTVKFGPEVHAEIAATRLAWALGFGEDEDYYVAAGKIEGVDSHTDLGKAKGFVQPDGSFTAARFKRHNKNAPYVKQPNSDADLNWSEADNPGVPQSFLSGLLIFDVLIGDFDAQPKNCKIVLKQTGMGPEKWFIVDDMGGSFGGDWKNSKWDLQAYQKVKPVVAGITGNVVRLNFWDASPHQMEAHCQIPLYQAQWFRAQLQRLTDAQIRAAFDAAFATPALDAAYASGDTAQIQAAEARLDPASQATINGFAAKFRERVNEFIADVPASATSPADLAAMPTSRPKQFHRGAIQH
jgi:hypothetical protein